MQKIKIPFSTAALLVVDVQMAFADQDSKGVQRSTPDAEANIAKLLAKFRQMNARVVHIHHHSQEKNSAFRAELPSASVQEFATPMAEEAVYIKHVNSAFIGTTLEQDLRSQGIDTLIICGGTANHCVETTTRMAGNLGFDAYYVSNGVWAYGGVGPDGRVHSPEDVLSMSLFNLDGEFATVMETDGILSALS